jgi:hypothetical protein
MIKIPFNRCVILTTLDFAQITNRLESAIYVGAVSPSTQPQPSSIPPDNSRSNHPRYFGQIRGFRFLATRIIGHKYIHLPIFLLPTVEGEIDSLHHGYEISLTVKLQNITCALLLTCLGGLFTTISSVLDNILVGTKNYQYLTIVQIVALFYVVVLTYFYFDAWRATKFFRALFVKKFTGATQLADFDRQTCSGDLQLRDTIEDPGARLHQQKLSIDLLRKNLPSFPSPSGKIR